MPAFEKLFTVIFLLSTSAVVAEDWPAFRGPDFDGVSPQQSAPTRWSSTENIKWKTALPRPADGSPIVVGGKVFVTSAEDVEGRERSLYCFNARNGKQQWVRTAVCDREMPTHKTNPYCGTTPASDGQHVVVWHATAGLFCYDLDGKMLWNRELGSFEHMWGYGTSPLFVEGRVVLHTGPSKQRSFVTALDVDRGSTIWEVDEPFSGDGERNADGKYMGSWSTPVVDRSAGATHLIVMQPTRVNAYDLETGKIVWFCRELNHERGDLAYSSPILGAGMCFVTGGFQGPSMAITLGGKGDVTSSHRLWREAKNPQSIGSGVFVDGYVYRPNASPGSLECIHLRTGKTAWKQRAGKASYWASIVAAGNQLYAIDQDGMTVVFKPNPEEFELISRNELGEPCNATPAIASGKLFVRAAEHLYCIGE